MSTLTIRPTRRAVVASVAAALALRHGWAWSASAQDAVVATMVTHGPGLGDRGYNDLADAGGNNAAHELGITWSVIESLDPGSYVPNVRAGAEQGGLTVGVGFLMADAIAQVAPDFPDDAFLLVDAVVDAPNVTSVVFREQEAAFLAGVVAAWSTSTDRVGFLGGQRVPPVERAEFGFRAAILAENPDCVIRSVYADSFEDPTVGKELALALFDDDIDVVFVSAGATALGAYEAAAERGDGHWIIGSDVDREFAAPGVQLCVARKGIDTAVFLAAEAVTTGTFAGGIRDLGLAEDGVSLETPGDRVDPAVLAQANAYRSRIIAGEFAVPASEQELKAWAPPVSAVPVTPCPCAD